MHAPGDDAEAVIVYCGAIAPEAIAAWEAMRDDIPGLGLLAITSPDLLHRGWSAQCRARWTGKPAAGRSHVEQLLGQLPRSAGLVTLVDGAPAALSWLGGVAGHKVIPLGVDRFGQTGNLEDLYRAYRLDMSAIVDSVAEFLLGDRCGDGLAAAAGSPQRRVVTSSPLNTPRS